MAELCRICHTRRPKRHCPGVDGDICTLCCGDQREVNISCPLDCQHLQEARIREKAVELDRATLPNQDIRLSRDFLDEHEELILFCSFSLAEAALRTPGAVDNDALNALDALIRTHRTLESGLVYETRADDRVAAAVQELLERSLEDFAKRRSEEARPAYRNAEVLGALVFLQRSLLVHRNGRPRGRAYIDFLRRGLNVPMPKEQSAGLVIT